MKQQVNPRPWVLASIILTAGMFRLITAAHTEITVFSNFTPLGAMALFGGCYYKDRWKAYLVPLITLWLTDIILDKLFYFHTWVFFYDGFAWVYASFVLMVMIGNSFRRVSIKSLILSSVAAALIHWLVSDFGFWIGDGIDTATGKRFTQDWHGLYRCYFLALPYMKNLLLGNLIFGAIFFGGFEFLQKRFPILQLTPAAL